MRKSFALVTFGILFLFSTLCTGRAKADIIMLSDPRAIHSDISRNAHIATNSNMSVEKYSNSPLLSTNRYSKRNRSEQSQDCTPTGTMWVNGPFDPESAAQAQRNLDQIGINASIEARSYGEIDNCGAYVHHGIDFTVTLAEVDLSAQSVDQTLVKDITSTLGEFGKPSLGKITLIDTQGEVIPANTYESTNDLQALDEEPLPPDAIFKKVYVIVYDPLLSNGQKLSENRRWNNHATITQQTIDFFKQASNNKLNYTVVDTTIVTSGWPELTDGFSYTESAYLAVLAGQQSPHNPNGVDYNKIVNAAEFDICGKANRGEIDEVWVYNGPWFGFYESTLVGPGAYYLNSSPIGGSHGCNRIIPIMGPSVERTRDEAVHNFTHRTEDTMKKVYGSWWQNNTSHSWNKFGLVKALSPSYSYSGCGSSHYPPNGTSGYDYGNTSVTLSNCNDFLNYPNLGDPLQVLQPVTCSIWGCTHLGYFEYWFGHFPSASGCGPDNVANDWWNYIANPAIALYPPNACQPGMRIISGNVGTGSTTLSYTDGVQKSVTSDSYGNYFLMVSDLWSGMVTPSRDGGYTFTPASREYNNVQGDSYNQDFTAVLDGPEISVRGNNLTILDGDSTPDISDYTDFGSIAVSSGTVSRTFTIYNTGGSDLNLTDSPKVALSGTHASDFSIIVLPASPIVPTGSTSFTVVFDPSGSGTRTTNVSIANDDSTENPYNFSIQGFGDTYPEMDVKGNNLSIPDGDATPITTDYTNFGSIAASSGTISRTFTIHNTGVSNLNLTGSPSVAINGTHASDFVVAVQPTSPIAPSGSTSFTVVFNPSAGSTRSAIISIANDDTNENPYNFSIQGTGVTYPEIDIRGNGISIVDGDTTPSLTDNTNFGNVQETNATLSHTFTIHNLGDGNLTLTGSPSKVLVTGTNSSDFTVAVQPTSPVVPGGSTSFTILFNPSALGLRTATLSVYSDDSNENPHNFSVQGTGTNLSLTVTKTADTNDGICDSDCSLREAIAVAPTGATIRFAPNLSGATINLSSTLILYRDVTIEGSALASKITISGDTENDGTGDVQVFLIFDSDVTSTLNSLSITKGANSTGGGGIYNYGNTTVTNCMFLDNSSGGIYNSSGTLTVTNSTFSGNSGGGIVSNNGTLLVMNSTFSDNSSVIEGGGILNYSTTTVVNSTFSDNSAEQGGGIYNGGTLVVTNSTFVGNSADTIGGGIYNNGPLTITNSTLSGNSAEQGSGVFNLDALNYANAIIANSISGGDCFNSGTIATNTNNLVEDDSCSPALSGDPKLSALTDNGGATQTMALVDGSPAINAGNNVACPSTDQRGVARPKGIYCDIGSFEYVDNTPPSVDSITRVGAANVSASSVDFIVTFSEPVTGIKTTVPFEDFSLTTSPGISGASITNVSGSGTNYTVTVNTGSGVGTIRLDIPNTATIVDLFENPLANLPFTSGETYTITTGDVFSSIAANDGWALESSEYSSRANARDKSGHLLAGDNAKNRQYRSLLYFDTSSLPEDAAILNVTLKIMRAGVTGTDPFTTHGTLFAEMKNGIFGKSPLENTDFQAVAYPKRSIGNFAPVSGEPDWYELVLNPTNFKYVNLKGVTQFRIRFTKDDDNDKLADIASFFSGDDPTNPPQLIVEYITP